MSTTFNGWMGYGTGVAANTLLEPADAAYARHPFALGDLDCGIAWNSIGGTAGPAAAGWGMIAFAAAFDAAQGGNMLFWMPLQQPVVVRAVATVTLARQAMRFLFPDLRGGPGVTQAWPAGAVVAELGDHRRVTAGVAMQFVQGTFSASAPVLGGNVVMANLPSNQPAAGTGQLWNNGGIISVA